MIIKTQAKTYVVQDASEYPPLTGHAVEWVMIEPQEIDSDLVKYLKTTVLVHSAKPRTKD